MPTELKDTDIITQPVRLSFPSLFEKKPTARGGDRLAYQAAILLPPDTDLAPYHAAMKAAMLDKFGKVLKLPAAKNPIKDCAEKDLDGYDEGWHFINVKSGYQPSVVDQRRQEIIDPERIYAGCWVRMHINAWCWDHPVGGKGVSFSLNAVQLVRDGERLDGRRATTDMFDEIEVEDMPDDAHDADVDAEELFG